MFQGTDREAVRSQFALIYQAIQGRGAGERLLILLLGAWGVELVEVEIVGPKAE